MFVTHHRVVSLLKSRVTSKFIFVQIVHGEPQLRQVLNFQINCFCMRDESMDTVRFQSPRATNPERLELSRAQSVLPQRTACSCGGELGSIDRRPKDPDGRVLAMERSQPGSPTRHDSHSGTRQQMGESAIQTDDLSGHPVVLRLQQPFGQRCHLFWLTESPQGMHLLRSSGCRGVLPDSSRQLGSNQPRADDIHTHILRRIGRRGRPCQPNNAPLSSRNRFVIRNPDFSSSRRKQDNRTPALAKQSGTGPNRRECGKQIRGDHFLKFFVGRGMRGLQKN